ncbi:MAG: hypothetical protein AB7S78_03690 [Candidatus Omnitrophota bacterium]
MIRLRSHVIKNLVKLCLLILLFLAPVLVLMGVFTPFASKKISERIVNSYQIPDDFKIEDITQIVKKMSLDPEFLFYFNVLDKENIARGAFEAYEIMNRSRSAETFLNEINLLQKKTKSLAVMFYHLEYTEDFVENPKSYPDLDKIMKDFLFEDFKLAVLGVCYKANYDESFLFKWDQPSRLAARKLYTIVKKLNK